MYKTQLERKEYSISRLKKLGIDYLESLPCTYEAQLVKMKDCKTILKRVIANILAIEVAFLRVHSSDDSDEAINYFTNLMKQYGVENDLTEFEKNIIKGNASKQDLINLTWQYESSYVLLWVLGLIDNLPFPSEACDVDQIVRPIAECSTFQEVLNKCELRDIEEILDELDIEYRYHWACVEKRCCNANAEIGNLNSEVVYERRRALEWLFVNEDWNDISLDT